MPEKTWGVTLDAHPMKRPLLKNIFEDLFYQSLRIRLVEERIISLYPSDKIQSPVHLSIGQEAVAVGVCQSLKKSDLVFGTYRNHAFYLAKGGEIKEMFAELYGKVGGMGQGKSGSMHLFHRPVGLMGSSAVVASTIPHAVGAALAAKKKKSDQVIVAVFGDGATEEGVFHESLNFAALHKVPVVLLCENNGLAVHSTLEARQSYAIAEQAKLYGIPYVPCEEGYDFEKVRAVFAKVTDQVRRQPSPYFVEIKTFRYKEHVGPGDDFHAGYRSVEALKTWQKNDPLIQRKDLVERFTPEIMKEIDEAVAFAERSPWPDREHLLADVM